MELHEWRLKAIDQKFDAVKKVRDSLFALKYQEAIEKSFYIEKEKRNGDLKSLQEKLLEGNRRNDEIFDTTKRMSKVSDKITGRVNVMATIIDGQFEPKTDQLMRITQAMNRKIDELVKVKHDTENRYNSETIMKTTKLDFCKIEIFNFSKKKHEVVSKFEDLAKDTAMENKLVNSLNIEIENGQTIVNKIDSLTVAIAQLTSEIEVQNEALQNLQQKNDSNDQELDDITENIKQANIQLQELEAQKVLTFQRYEDIKYLMEFINNQINLDDLERDGVFHREMIASNLYNECKEDYNQIILDNNAINCDLEKTLNGNQEAAEIILKLRKEIADLDAMVASFQVQVGDLKNEQKLIKSNIEARKREVHNSEDSITKEIFSLKTELISKTEDLERINKKAIHQSKKFNLELKKMQNKTQKVNKMQRYKLKKREPLSQGYSHLISSQPNATTVCSEAFLKQKPILKRHHDETDIAVCSMSPMKRLSLPNQSQSTAKRTNEATVKKRYEYTYSLQKENQMNIQLSNEVEDTANRKEEKAFDSDDPSMNITFNSDIDELLN